MAEGRYTANEATDVFQALEQVSDFTVREMPEVVYLRVDQLEAELEMLELMLVSPVGEPCASVIAFSEQDNRSGFDASGFGGLDRQLSRLIPNSQQTV